MPEEPEKNRYSSPAEAAKMFGPEGGRRRLLELLSQLNNLTEVKIESAPNQTGILGRVAGLVTFGSEKRFIYLAGALPKAQGEDSELINQLRGAIDSLPETDFSIKGVEEYVGRLIHWGEVEHAEVAIGLILGSSMPSRQPITVLYRAPVLTTEEASDLLKNLAFKEEE